MQEYKPQIGCSPPQIISREVDNFVATWGTDNRIYLVEVNKEGAFTLKQGLNDGWKEAPFFQEKNRIISNLQMLGDTQGMLHLIYLLRTSSTDQWWLVHHNYFQGRWSDPRVIDFGGKGMFNYSHILVDSQDTLHAAYHVQERSGVALYHRTFAPYKSLTWSQAELITTDESNAYPFLIEGEEQTLHLVWTSFSKQNYTVNYSHKAVEQNNNTTGYSASWSPPQEISALLTEPPLPFLELRENKLLVQWILKKAIYRRASSDNGMRWTKTNKEVLKKETGLIRITAPPRENSLPGLSWLPVPHEDSSNPEKILAIHSAKDNSSTQAPNDQSSTRAGSANPGGIPRREKLHRTGSTTSKSQSYPSAAGNSIYATTDSKTIPKPPTKKPEKESTPTKAAADNPKGVSSNTSPNTLDNHSSPNSPGSPDSPNNPNPDKEMEKKLNRSLNDLQKKHEASRKAWEEENLRLVKEVQKLKQEIASLKKKTKEIRKK